MGAYKAHANTDFYVNLLKHRFIRQESLDAKAPYIDYHQVNQAEKYDKYYYDNIIDAICDRAAGYPLNW